MNVQRRFRLRVVILCALGVATLSLIACNTVTTRVANAEREPDTQPSGRITSLDIIEAGSTGEHLPLRLDLVPFQNARCTSLAENGVVSTELRLTPSDTLVVFDLGPAENTDCVIVKQTNSIEVYARVAFFDGNYDLLTLGVFGSSATAGERTVVCDLHEPVARVYLAIDVPVQFTPLDLALEVTRDTHDKPQCEVASFILLDFDGALIDRVGMREDVRVQPFRAAALSQRLAARTVALKRLIIDAVRHDFDPMGISVYERAEVDSSARGALVAHVGRADITNLGAASGVAVINTAALSFLDRYNPTEAEWAQAVSNVIGHEVGHLLGLSHTTEPYNMMCSTASAANLLLDQSLSRGSLDPAVFPIGAMNCRKWIHAHSACHD